MPEVQKQREEEPERRRKRKKKISKMKLKETYGIEIEPAEEERGYPAVEVGYEEDFLLPEEEAEIAQEKELEQERTKERIRTKILQKQQEIDNKATAINLKIKMKWQESLSKYINAILQYMEWPMYREERVEIFKRIYTYLDYIAGSVISDREDNREGLHIHSVQQYFDQTELQGILNEVLEVPYIQMDALAETIFNNLDSETEKLEGIVDQGIVEFQEYLDKKFSKKPRPKNAWKAVLQRKTEFASMKIRELDSNAYLRALRSDMIRPAAIMRGFAPPEEIVHEEEVLQFSSKEHPELESIDEDINKVAEEIAILEERGYEQDWLNDADLEELDDLYSFMEELQEERKIRVTDLIQRGYE